MIFSLEHSRLIGQVVGFGRYHILSELGSGGMGRVFRALDLRSGGQVALKTVGRVEGQALLRFKREFRALEELQHPNLISLGEMFEELSHWFYTMELLEGVDFIDYVRPRATPMADLALHPSGFDEARLRSALIQLVRGVDALHGARKVHRDLKPSNIQVTARGRVVVLDLGLVAHLEEGEQASDVGAVGTAAYMSPEQAQAKPVDTFSDWYAVGVILHEALTGRLTFTGAGKRGVVARVLEEPPDPQTIAPGIPDDLAALCRDLMARRPDARPAAPRILERLRAGPAPPTERMPRASSHGGGAAFVGRGGELHHLLSAFEAVCAGEPRSVLIRGESGIGKTRLIDELLERLRGLNDPAPLCLRGRCFARESHPYRSMDGIVDALSSHLSRLPDEEIEPLVPAYAGLLVQAFPVLRKVRAFSRVVATGPQDPREQRARVFTALRELFQALSRRRRLVVILEDLQWLDEDSALLSSEVFRRPSAPNVLFIAAEIAEPRGDGEAHAHPALAALSLEVLELPRLSPPEARAMAEEILSSTSAGSRAHLERVVRESGGHPLFLDELARYAADSADDASPFSFESAVERRLDAAGPLGSSVLELLAVAGTPVKIDVLSRAARSEVAECARACATLRVLRLLRSTSASAFGGMDVYHQRLREVVIDRLDEAALCRRHADLARAYEGSESPDPIPLAVHWEAAGRPDRAARHAIEAAELSEAAWAFDRAAAFYEKAIALLGEGDPDAESQRARLAECLANAGRGYEAGQAYRQASLGERGARAIDLRRRSAEQLLLSGHFEEGISGFRGLLDEVGIAYPERSLPAALSLLWHRLLVLLSSLRLRHRNPNRIEPLEVLRARTARSVAHGLIAIDPMRGADFSSRALLGALRIGDAELAVPLLSMEAANRVLRGKGGRKGALWVLDRARSMAREKDNPYLEGAAWYGEGLAHYLLGEWRDALEAFIAAEGVFRERCAEAPPELRTLQATVVHCQWELGEWPAMQERVGRYLGEARERGDLFTHTTLATGCGTRALLVRGRPEDARRRVADAMERWPGKAFHVQHYQRLVDGAHLDLYAGEPTVAHRRFVESEAMIRKSRLMYAELMRFHLLRSRAFAAIARARVEPPSRRRLLAEARAIARSMLRRTSGWIASMGHMILGCASTIDARDDQAVAALERAVRAFDANDMGGWASLSRFALGRLEGGEEGRERCARAEEELRSRGVQDPPSFVRAFSPTRFDELP